ncbi:hypothetical protein J2S10_003286 [Neobacillus ginsengisoli]|uniref:Uncharacterized protein n=1 Tax=Neobacillus ginsengisoli TaxID=904295 RepID=A0ABT9XX08_9BACI|nr:hypothetical protein [Neobacillus ginsengisoli]
MNLLSYTEIILGYIKEYLILRLLLMALSLLTISFIINRSICRRRICFFERRQVIIKLLKDKNLIPKGVI